MNGLISNLKLKIQKLKELFGTLSFPKTWNDCIETSQILLKTSFLIIQIIFFIYLPLMVLGFLSSKIEPDYGLICIGLTYGYFLLIFHLGIWIILPSYGLIIVNKFIESKNK
jgi:hypothetical protein